MLDASATLPWRFEDETTPWTESLLERIKQGEHAVVPAHWPIEVLNGLLMAQRRARVTADEIREFVEDLAVLPIRLEPAHSPAVWAPLVAVAQRYRLTIYDAAYLELAQRLRLLLATLDEELLIAARGLGIGIVDGG